jgi:hypothetical protein
MDIRGWLQGIVAEEQRGRPEDLAFPPFLRSRDNGDDPLVKSRKFHKPTNASSFLEPAKAPAWGGSVKGDHLKHPKSLSSITGFAAANSRVESLGTGVVENHTDKYTKQPRRKTRPDLYNCKTDSGGHDDRKQSSRKRKKPQNDEKRTRKKRRLQPESMQARNFHADNVTTERLTVRIPLDTCISRC